jgi:inorganic triphosphatase YgiF
LIAAPDCGNDRQNIPSTMPQEIEIRFAASERDLARVAKSSRLDGYVLGRAEEQQLNSIYYDTPELSLAKAGLSLRVRKTAEGYVQTVKDESTGSLLSQRPEYECRLASPHPDLARISDPMVRERVRTIINGSQIEPAVETDILRITRAVKSDAGDEIELAVDRGEIRASAGTPIPVHEIELELKKGSPAVLYDVARQLSRKIPLTAGIESKLARGVRILEGQEICAHKAGRVELPQDCTAEEAFRAILLHCLRHIARNAEAVAEARLPEGVHQIRVGLRRLRAAISAFGLPFRVRELETLRERAKIRADIFGDTRELDVFAAELLPPVEQSTKAPGLPQLRLVLDELRRDSWDRAVDLVRSDDFTGFLLDLAAAIESRVWRQAATAESVLMFLQPARDLASEALKKKLKQAHKRARHLASLDIADRHRLRIALKKLRYTAEFFAPLFPAKGVSSFLKRLSKLQDLFGILNDAAAAEAVVRRVVEHAGPRRDTEFLEAAAFVEGWHKSRIEPAWDKTKKRWKRFAKTDPFWEN